MNIKLRGKSSQQKTIERRKESITDLITEKLRKRIGRQSNIRGSY